jgi:hypothetical protein
VNVGIQTVVYMFKVRFSIGCDITLHFGNFDTFVLFKITPKIKKIIAYFNIIKMTIDSGTQFKNSQQK